MEAARSSSHFPSHWWDEMGRYAWTEMAVSICWVEYSYL